MNSDLQMNGSCSGRNTVLSLSLQLPYKLLYEAELMDRWTDEQRNWVNSKQISLNSLVCRACDKFVKWYCATTTTTPRWLPKKQNQQALHGNQQRQGSSHHYRNSKPRDCPRAFRGFTGAWSIWDKQNSIMQHTLPATVQRTTCKFPSGMCSMWHTPQVRREIWREICPLLPSSQAITEYLQQN